MKRADVAEAALAAAMDLDVIADRLEKMQDARFADIISVTRDAQFESDQLHAKMSGTKS